MTMTKETIKQTFLQGLVMAAVVATALPLSTDAFAQLSAMAPQSQNSVFNPVLQLLSYGCYVVGGVLVVAGVMKFKSHSENPTNHPLSHGFSRAGAGAALLALPYLMGLANQTASNTMTGTSSFRPFTF